MALPAVVTVGTAMVVTVALAIALSPRFPIGVARRYDLDVGVHADIVVLVGALLLLVVSVLGLAAITAWWRATRLEREPTTTSTTARWIANTGVSPTLLIGSRLAVEPGRGRRAVPVRSALVGAIVGVLGVVACFTFRAGIEDAAATPARSGIVWDFAVAAGPGTVAPADARRLVDDPAVGSATHALWTRALPVGDVSTSAWGIADRRGRSDLVVVNGRAPRDETEIAFAPTTLDQLGLEIGDTVEVGRPARALTVVGEALLPASSHTAYDSSAWLTLPGLRSVLGPGSVDESPDDFEDYYLFRWRDGADVTAAEQRMRRIAAAGEYFAGPLTLPSDVIDLAHLATMPLVLAVFFGLLACATVAHALVTTVRRRRFDLAVLRSMGFTRTQSRGAIAWQSALLAACGLVVGIPLGLVLGRTLWRYVAEDFPIAYVPPIEVLVVLVVIPVALLIAQALAAGPAHAATRIRPAQTLRTE
jgi:hypothetical protein